MTAPPPPAPGSGPAPTPPPMSQNSRTLASVAHLSALAGVVGIPSFLGPLVVLLASRDDPYAQQESREALNFNLSILIYLVAAMGLTIATLGLGLLILLPAALVAVIAWFVLVIIAGIRASDGHGYRYPLTLRLVA